MSPRNLTIDLILWDATAEPQVQRLRQQRLICGWGADRVDEWRYQRLLKQKALYWIVLNRNHKLFNQYMHAHTQTFPLENGPLFSSSTTKPFIPIGHVSVNLIPSTTSNPSERRYYASNLYLSPALRGRAFARESIEGVMDIMANAPFFATDAVAEVPVSRTAGGGKATFSLPAWYEMLGWTRVKDEAPRYVVEVDTKGMEVKVELLLYECDIRGHRRVMEKAVL